MCHMDADERDLLVEAVKGEVIAFFAESHDVCRNADQVRNVVTNGVDRASYNG